MAKIDVGADISGALSKVKQLKDEIASAGKAGANIVGGGGSSVGGGAGRTFTPHPAPPPPSSRQGGGGGGPQLPAVLGGGIGQPTAGPQSPNAIIPYRAPPPPSSRQRGGFGAYTNAPHFSSIGHNLIAGFGGGFGQVASYATRGAIAGARGGGGALGGGMGLLRGGLIGAAAFGALKIGQSVSEGYGMAKERAGTLDVLKRQMGDLGISFTLLKAMTESAADGLGINSKEAAKLAQEFNRLSRGADRSPGGLADSVRTAVGTSRAYGLDPSASVNFYAGMQNINPKQNNRELAILIAEAVEKSGMSARADELMQSIQSFAAVTSRNALSAPNIGAYAAGYSSLMGPGKPIGMTSDVASSILGQANSSVMRMGSMGEAGKNFIMSAFNAHGTMNPIQSMALSEGGLFGSRGSVFGAGSALSQYMGGINVGGDQNITNFDAIKQHLARQGGDKWLQLDSAKNLFGMSSLSQTAALMNMDGRGFGGLQKALGAAGINPNDVNASGLQTLSRIGLAGGKGDLSTIYQQIGRRTGRGALSEAERSTLDQAQGGSTEDFRKALIRIAASKDQEETEASKMRDQLSRIEEAEISVGDNLLKPMEVMRDALLALAGKDGKSSTAASLHERALAAERDEVTGSAAARSSAIRSASNEQISELVDKRNKLVDVLTGASSVSGQKAPDRVAVKKEIDAIDQQMRDMNTKRTSAVAKVEEEKRKSLAEINSRDNVPESDLFGKVMQRESGGRQYDSNGKIITSSKGARGISQVMPKTGVDPGYGVKPLQNQSEEEYRRFGNDYLNAMLKEFGGDKSKALAAYNAGPGAVHAAVKAGGSNWLSQLPSETQAYVPGILGNDMGSSPMPGGGASGGSSGGGANDTLHVKIDMSSTERGANGQVTTKTQSTVVPIPRGSGNRSVSLAN